MEKANETLTITMTGRAPVKINKDEWPILAESSEKEYDGEYEFQSNRTAKFSLKLRQHADGRFIVYGVHSYDSKWQHEKNRNVRGGWLYEKGDDLSDAISEAGKALEETMPEEVHYSRGYWPRLARECTADLPAEVI